MQRLHRMQSVLVTAPASEVSRCTSIAVGQAAVHGGGANALPESVVNALAQEPAGDPAQEAMRPTRNGAMRTLSLIPAWLPTKHGGPRCRKPRRPNCGR